MKNSETVILTNISKHKRRIVTHKKMKSGILDLVRARDPPTEMSVRGSLVRLVNSKKSYYEDKEATYKISLGDDLADFIEKIKSIDIQSGLIRIDGRGSR